MTLPRAANRRSARSNIAYRRNLTAAKPVWPACALALTLAASTAAHAQNTADAGKGSTLTIERYGEDWSYLADPAERTGRWTERFKYIPLQEDGSIYLTTGVEARSRYEGYQNVNWGSQPNDGYVWHRLMPYADLHAGKFRVFAQPIISGMSGGGGRPKTPVDSAGIDMVQGFAEVEIDLGSKISLSVSAGRKLVGLGSGRYIDTRYGPGILQPFDGVDATLGTGSHQIRMFYLRPVTTRVGHFDDQQTPGQAVWGAYATQWLGAKPANGIDVFYIGFRGRDVIFDQGIGEEIVHTFGSRIFGDTGTWYWNFEGSFQRGRFAGLNVSAWGAGGEFGHRFLNTALQPDLRFEVDFVSGDDDPTDNKLGTLNPLFPNGKFFGSLTPIGPRNLIHVRQSAIIHPSKTVEVSLTGAAFWRESKNDGVYSIPGLVVRSGRGSDARFVGTQVELAAAWQATPELNLSMALSAFNPGRFIRETGPAETIRMITTTANFRF